MMRARVKWWIGYMLLVSAAIIAVIVVSANPVAGFIAGGGVVLSATWTAARYDRDF